jgi:hypothetical protein
MQQEIQKMLSSPCKESTYLNQIIGKLIAGASSVNQTIRTLSIGCLSHLGAIDPGHWIVAHGFSEKSTFFFDSSCAEFVCRALETMLDGFQASTGKAEMDIIGFVCQEFMKANGFQDEPAKAPVQIWSRFSEQTQTMLLPFFKTAYTLKLSINLDDLPQPLFGSKCGQTFEDWIFHWVVRLIGMISNKTIRDTFDALKWIFKINLKNIEFFLPHIFIHAVWAASDEDFEKILEEMICAAKLDGGHQRLSEEEMLEAVLQVMSLNFDMQSFVDLHSKEVSSTRNEIGWKCAKVIFFLIDYLIHWNLEYELPAHGNLAKTRPFRESTGSDSTRDFKLSALAHKYKKNKSNCWLTFLSRII